MTIARMCLCKKGIFVALSSSCRDPRLVSASLAASWALDKASCRSSSGVFSGAGSSPRGAGAPPAAARGAGCTLRCRAPWPTDAARRRAEGARAIPLGLGGAVRGNILNSQELCWLDHGLAGGHRVSRGDVSPPSARQ